MLQDASILQPSAVESAWERPLTFRALWRSSRKRGRQDRQDEAAKISTPRVRMERERDTHTQTRTH
eukprot:3268499-Amphidinium_carterae.1